MLRISGADTLSFAHAQFSSDAQGLAIGKWHWSAWLTPKGRVTALFALYRPAENELLLILPDGEAVMMAPNYSAISSDVKYRSLWSGISLQPQLTTHRYTPQVRKQRNLTESPN